MNYQRMLILNWSIKYSEFILKIGCSINNDDMKAELIS